MRFAAALLIVALAGCSAKAFAPSVTPPQDAAMGARVATTQYPIHNLIVIVQEFRSFDNLFAGFPNADAPIQGLMKTPSGLDVYVRLRPVPLEHTHLCANEKSEDWFNAVYDHGKMDGWGLIDPKDARCPYTRVERGETRPYWELAKHFTLADHMFSSTHFGNFPNQLYLIAGTTRIRAGTYDIPPISAIPWNCDAPPGTKTSLLRNGKVEAFRGPYPCFTQFPTIADLLDRANVSWRYYLDGDGDSVPFNPFSAIKDVRLGGDWQRNMRTPASKIFTDLRRRKLADVSWVLSPRADSDAPGNSGGPQWVASIVRAAQKSRYWQHAAIVVVWDDPGDGNYYDDVAPELLDSMGLGVRVPMIIVSPLAKRKYVSHTQYEFGSILKFMEENWNLGSLGATDQRANSIGDVFTFF